MHETTHPTPAPRIDEAWMTEVLLQLLRTPSPTGRTDQVMQLIGEVIERDLGLDFELTRRGSLIATLPGEQDSPDRAIVVHADTIGMMVKALLPTGRLEVVPIGTHSSRFSEGARVTIFTDDRDTVHTGTVLPRKASGHAYDDEVDTQGVGWEHVEVRVDLDVRDADGLRAAGIRVGDFVAAHALPEITPSGFVKSRHLDDKGGVAAALAAFKALADAGIRPPVTAHLLVTIAEEVGHGAAHGLHGDVAEMISIDTAVVAPSQQSREDAVTVAMQDLHGPFDFHLARRLLRLGEELGIDVVRDVFTFYRSDVAAAIEAGAETRAALIGFGTDATHGHERTTVRAITDTARLVARYLCTDLTFANWDEAPSGPLRGFPSGDQPAGETPVLQDGSGEPNA